MNANRLFESLQGIDEDILERSENTAPIPQRRFPWAAAIAACCVLVCSLGLAYVTVQNRNSPHTPTTPPVLMTPTQPVRQVVDTPFYNEAALHLVAAERFPYTINSLYPEDMENILPTTLADWMDFTAELMFLEDGTPYRLFLSTPTTVEGGQISVIIGPYTASVDAGANPVYYRCGETEYAMWEQVPPGDYVLGEIGAKATIHGQSVYFLMEVQAETAQQAKADFEELLACFATYSPGKPSFSEYLPIMPAHSWNRSFSKDWLQRNSHYGIYLPSEDGHVYSNAEITWEKGDVRNQISVDCYWEGNLIPAWKSLVLEWIIYSGDALTETGADILISGYSESIDASELTLEVVEQFTAKDTADWGESIFYNIVYDDIIISVSPHDVSAQWLYDQLIAVQERSAKAPKQAVAEFEKMLEKPLPEDLTLTVYYMSPAIFTYAPVMPEELKSFTGVKTISVDREYLAGHVEQLKKLNTSLLQPSEHMPGMNARMCYVFETGDGETLLEIATNGVDCDFFVNGMMVQYDPAFYEAIQPFLTEDFYATWQIPKGQQ